jgi:hypothetical protein
VIPILSDKCVATCDCVIIHLLEIERLHCLADLERNPRAKFFKFRASLFADGKRVFEQVRPLDILPQGFPAAAQMISQPARTLISLKLLRS